MERETFSSGEQYVALAESVRDKIVFLIQTCRERHIAKDYDQLYLMADAAINADSGKRIAVIPHFGYARQDKIHKKREPISARVIARNLEANGIDCVITCELHSPQIQGFFNIPLYHIKLQPLFAEYFKSKFKGVDINNVMVVSTDAGGDKNARELAKLLGIESNVATILKTRKKHNHSKVNQVVGDVKGKICILFDDMIDTSGSAGGAKRALIKQGANPDVYMCATHPIFSGRAISRLKKANFKEVVVSDTLPLEARKHFKGLKQISVAPLIADWMSKIIGKPLTHKPSVQKKRGRHSVRKAA